RFGVVADARIPGPSASSTSCDRLSLVGLGASSNAGPAAARASMTMRSRVTSTKKKMNCPVCKNQLAQAGHTHKCKQCNGAWVREDALVAMLEASTATLVELPWRDNQEDHARPCPTCGTTMKTVALGTVALDRCEQ